ncbi:MAG: hypothetical protein ACLUEK_01865 [Oscillospiraceae bacterium]
MLTVLALNYFGDACATLTSDRRTEAGGGNDDTLIQVKNLQISFKYDGVIPDAVV